MGRLFRPHLAHNTMGHPIGDPRRDAHPHRDCRRLVVVHKRSIVENYLSLNDVWKARGHTFVTGDPTTEIIVT